MTDEKVRQIISSADVNSDGEVDVSEFINVMRRFTD